MNMHLNSLTPLAHGAALEPFMPPQLSGTNSVDEMRARILLLATFGASTAALLFSVIYRVILDTWIVSAGTLTALVLVLFGALVLRKTSSIALTGHWIAFSCLIAIVWIALFTGGVESPVAPWISLLAMFAMLFAGGRAGVIWGIAGLVSLLTVFALQSYGVVVRQLLPDDSLPVVWTLANGSLLALGAFFFLLNNHLQSWLLEHLEGQKAKLSAILETAPNGIVTVDQSGVIQAVNNAAEKIFDRPQDQILGARITDLVPTLRGQLGDNEGDRNFRPLSLKSSSKHRGLRPDDQEFPVSLSISPFEGRPADRAVMVIRDDTRLRQIRAEMMQMDRVSTIGTMARGLGHEINNPLSYVKGNINYIHHCLESIDEDETNHDVDDLIEALEDSVHGLDRIAGLVAELRQFSSDGDEHELQSVNVENILDSTLAITRNDLRHRAQLRTEYGDVPPVLGDVQGLGQICLNLLLNAAEAIPEGNAEENEIIVRTEVADDYVIVSVTDTGTGIEESVLDRIFDPFYTTRPPDEGTGLGLAISQSLIDEMGGLLSVDSQPGEGSTFSVRLPIAPVADAVQAETSSPGLSPPQTLGGRILCVDDEPMVCRTLERELSLAFDVHCEHEASKALELLVDGEQFDVLLVDLLMPTLTGRQFFEAVEQHRPEMLDRIVIITGGAFTRESREFLDQRDVPYLEKPIDPTRLFEVLEERIASPAET